MGCRVGGGDSAVIGGDRGGSGGKGYARMVNSDSLCGSGGLRDVVWLCEIVGSILA